MARRTWFGVRDRRLSQRRVAADRPGCLVAQPRAPRYRAPALLRRATVQRSKDGRGVVVAGVPACARHGGGMAAAGISGIWGRAWRRAPFDLRLMLAAAGAADQSADGRS